MHGLTDLVNASTLPYIPITGEIKIVLMLIFMYIDLYMLHLVL